MRKKLLPVLLALFALCNTALFAQTSRVTGTITGPDNKPIAGASVTIAGTSMGTVTDTDGKFALTAPSDASILVNSIGFTDKTVKVDGRSSVNVQLVAGQSAGLDEVVVTGYTSQKKKDIVGSVAVVDVKALKAVPSSSALQALQGQASGVDIINSASPGGQSSIFIRGITGFATAPLILIDGIQSRIEDVPANDVESIQVLKDAGAASIYGARGANGVIVITTKKGKSGKATINYNSYYNWQMPRSSSKLNVLSATEYARLYSEVVPSSGLLINGSLADYFYRQGTGGIRGVANAGDPLVDPSLYRLNIANPDNSYIISKSVKDDSSPTMYDELFNPALMMNHSISASGGTDRSNYLLAFGYLDQQGTLKNSSLKRYNARINTTFAVGNHVRLGENVNITYKNNPTFSSNGAFGPIQTAMNNIPIIPVYDIKGNFAGDFAGPATELGDWGNALADATLVGNNRKRDYGVVGNAFLEVDFLKNFTARSSLGGSFDNDYDQFYEYRAYWRRNANNDDKLTESSGFSSLLQWTNTLTYKKTWGQHNLSVLVGLESIETQFRNHLNIATGFFSDDYDFLNPTTGRVQQPVPKGTYAGSSALYSKIGRVDYSFADKYLVGFTIRNDGFAYFGPERKYGTFPSIALGWRMSQESFMKNVSWVNDLKLRASYGILGNKESVTQPNQYNTYSQSLAYSFYNISGNGTNAVQGFYPGQYGNRSTSWEENKLFNIGVDATLFNNKLDLSLEYYTKRTDGLLRPIPLPGTVGEGASPFVNIGDIQNKGVDINVNYRARLAPDVQLTVGANFTAYRNKIISLPEPGYYDEGITRNEEGWPISSFFGYKVIGLYNDTNQVKAGPLQSDAAPGRYRYLDVDGNDTISDKDRMHLGDPNPAFTMGVNLGLTFKNFDFGAQIYTVQDVDIYNATYDDIGSFAKLGNKSKLLLNAWTPTNTNTRIRKNETAGNFSTGANTTTSQWIEDGSFVRLRMVQLGYSFKPSTLSRAGISKLRIYVQGTNLVTLTKYSGLDPEVVLAGAVQRGIDAGAYVPEKGVVFGLDLTF